MRLPRPLAVLTLIASVASTPAQAAPAGAPAGHGAMNHPFSDHGMVAPSRPPERPRVLPEGGANAALYPTYVWPLERANHDGVHVAGYVDEDSTAGFRDYMNGDWTYDTHRGTDIALDDFRAMDRGVRVLSAAAGTVTYLIDSNLRDRNCDEPDNPTLNYIEIANGDGTYTYYYHLRSNSATVNVGESVAAGEVIGFAGSSGYSFGPHLHFEPADWLSGNYVRRDPWGGPGNPQPGLWQAQAPYNGAQHLITYDLGVTTQAAAGGDLANVDYCATIAEHLAAPVTFGIHEPWFPIWFYFQGLAGDSYRIEIHRPDDSLWDWVDYTLPGVFYGGYHYWYWNWDPYMTAADYGTWTVRILVGGSTVRQTSVVVGPTTVYGPRFKRSGRSFRINGTVWRDTLRISPLGGPVTYALVRPPAAGVTLVDSILTVGPTSSQRSRSWYFQVVATDAAARRDTAFFHLVDGGKPREALVGVDPAPTAPTLALMPARPNPSASETRLRFTVARDARVELAIYDLGGRRLRTLLDRRVVARPQGEEVGWDGRDAGGRRVAGGIYFARMTAGSERRVARIVRTD